MSSGWTHAICERCWFDGPWGVLEGGAYRMPTRVKDHDPTACCFCGGMTIMGIYVRRDPADAQVLLCLGEHAVLGWSRVGTEG